MVNIVVGNGDPDTKFSGDSPKYSFIMMSCGYVEQAQTSWLMYGTPFLGSDGFSTMEEAIKELALDLYSKFYDDSLNTYERRYSLKNCCHISLNRIKSSNYCSECGDKLDDKQFIAEEFRDYIRGMHNTTADSYGESEQTSMRQLVWWPYSMHEFREASKESIIWIAESAEHVLLDALYDAKPELAVNADEDEYQNYAEGDWEQFKSGQQPSYR